MTRRDPMLRSHERAERQEMASTVTIRRPGAATVDADGDLSAAATLVYSDRASIIRADNEARTLSYGERAQTVTRYEVLLLRGGVDVRERDIVTVDTSPDPTLKGMHLRVVDAGGSDWSASPSLACEEA